MDRISVAMDATPMLGSRTGVGVAVAGMITQVAARPEISVTGYGFTLRGSRRLPGVLPSSARASNRPMPAAALLRIWGRVDWPAGDWWTGPVEVVHGTNFVVPPSRRAARVVSVWDLTAVRYPELCSPTARRYPAAVARAVAGGAWVHTGSRFVAGEIAERFGADPDRIRVIPPGVDVAPAGPGGSRPYVLGMGTTEPRKDFPGLIEAFDLLAADHPDLELRLAGPPGWGEDEVRAAIEGSARRERIVRLGWVEDPAALIAGAAVFAYPSLYEGFGLPPLEAMGHGVPVVATAAGAVPEVVGEAAELVPPRDPAALAAAIARVLDDSERRAELIRRGFERVAGFSWEACGDELVQLYRDVVGGR